MEQQKETNALMIENNKEIEIDLMDLLRDVFRHWKLVVLLTLLGMVAFAVYAVKFTTPVYESTAQLYVVNSSDSVVHLSDLQIGSYLTEDYILIFDTWEVNQMVIENLDLPYSVNRLKNMVKITNPSDSRVIYITVRGTDRSQITLIANEMAKVGSQYISDVMLMDKPTLLSEALVPISSISRSKTSTAMTGALVGLFAAVAILVIRYLLDDKVKNSADIQKYTGMMPLAVIPLDTDVSKKKGR